MHLPKPSEGGTFTPPPAGTFPAICYRILDLGTQQSSYQGRVKRQHKVLISWELKDDEAVTEDGKPMSIHQRYTWSMHEKAALRKHLESWRGKTFTDADFGEGGFDIRKLLGVPCFIGIVHEHKDGKTYANISAISKLPKGMEAGSLINPPFYMWLTSDLFNREEFAKLSDSLQDVIRSSPEYQAMMNGAPSEAVVDADNGDHPFAPGSAFDEQVGDAIPF